MTTNSREYVEHILEKLEPLGNLDSGRFFGGTGIRCRLVQFAMLMGNTLYFVVDSTTRPRYVERGSKCFSYHTTKKEVLVQKYYEVPEELLDDLPTLQEWARESIRVAQKLNKTGGKKAR